MKRAWSDMKVGVIPLIVIAIPIFLAYSIWACVKSWGIPFSGNQFIDVPANTALILAASWFLGRLIKLPILQDFARTYLPTVPVIGPILLRMVVPSSELLLVEIKTVPGLTLDGDDGCWEYALVTCKPWHDAKGVKWYRVHTLGWTGRLISRISERNVHELSAEEQKHAWMTILSLGLI